MVSGEYSTKKNFTDCIETDLVLYMRVKGLKWAGHVVRMFYNRIISYDRIKSQRKKARWKAKEWIKRQSVNKLFITKQNKTKKMTCRSKTQDWIKEENERP